MKSNGMIIVWEDEGGPISEFVTIAQVACRLVLIQTLLFNDWRRESGEVEDELKAAARFLETDNEDVCCLFPRIGHKKNVDAREMRGNGVRQDHGELVARDE